MARTPPTSRSAKRQPKVEKVMHEWGKGELHSGSKHGPLVKNQKQALAIGFSEQRKLDKGK
jgi:hypothetical protein